MRSDIEPGRRYLGCLLHPLALAALPRTAAAALVLPTGGYLQSGVRGGERREEGVTDGSGG